MELKSTEKNNTPYADDTILTPSTVSGLQRLSKKLLNSNEGYGLKFNIRKTKYMTVSRKNQHETTTLKIKSTEIERIKNSQFSFNRVSFLNENWDNTKLHYTKCDVWSVLICASETWTLKAKDEKRLRAIEMWIYRRLLRIPWSDHMSNREVLRSIDQDCQFVTIIKQRKIK